MKIKVVCMKNADQFPGNTFTIVFFFSFLTYITFLDLIQDKILYSNTHCMIWKKQFYNICIYFSTPVLINGQ